MKCKNCGEKIYAKEICQCGEKAPNIHGKGVAANTIICAVILVVSVISLILSITLRNIVNNDLLAKTVENINLCDIEVENKDGNVIKLDQYIYDEFVDDSRITVQNVDNVLNDPFIKKFITEKIQGYQKFLLDEGEMVYITSDDIVNLIEENSNLLYNEAGLNFLEPDKAELKNNLSGLDKFSDFSKNYMTGWFSSSFVQTYFSQYFVYFLIALIAVILIQWVVVYYLNGRRILKALKKYSIAIVAPSSLIFLTSIVPIFFDDKGLAYSLTNEIKTPLMMSSGIILAAGVILLVISIVFSINKKKANIVPLTTTEKPNVTVPTPELQMPIDNNNTSEPKSNLEYTSFAPTINDNEETLLENNHVNLSKNDTDIVESISDENKIVNLEPKKVFCTKCGHENRSNSSFCSKCGEKLRIN